jgi:hypothetical protein
MGYELFDSGRERFNAGDFFAAHELWEDLWRETRGPARTFIQGMVQVAVGLHHHSTGNVTGARSVLARGLRNMARAQALDFECDFAQWQAELQQFLKALEQDLAPPLFPRL